MFIAQIGGDVRASNLGRRSHQVIALAASGQLGVAATGQIRLAVVTTGRKWAPELITDVGVLLLPVS